MDQYYYLEGDQRAGPVSLPELVSTGVQGKTLLWKNGMKEWAPASSFSELTPHFSRTVPPPPPAARVRETPQKRNNERLDSIRQRNLEKMRALKGKAKSKLKVLAERVNIKGIKNRYRLFNLSFWLNISVIPLWLGALFAVEKARDNYWMHEWVYPEGQLDAWTSFVMDNHLHGENITAIAGLIFCVMAAITFFARLNFLHYAWSGIQDGEVDTAPNAAVGYLLIPGYHFIWMFTAYKTLADEMRNMVLEKGYEDLGLIKPELAQWFCISRIGICIPIINILAVIPMFIFNGLYHKNIKKGMIYLLEQKKLQKVEYKNFEAPTTIQETSFA